MLSFILILFLFILLCLSACLASSETAFFSLSHYTVRTFKESPDGRKRLIADLLDRPRELMVTILMLNVIVNILIQNVVSSFFETWLGKVGVPLLLVLFLGEVFPKAVALPNNEKVALILAPYVNRIERFLGPIRNFLTRLTSAVSGVMFFFLKKEEPISTDELQHIIASSEKRMVLTQEESKLISGYLDLYEALVKAKMRPKADIYFYDCHKPLQNLLSLFTEKGYSRIPVCDGGIDQILGILSLEQFYAHKAEIQSPQDVKRFLQKPFFIPETTSALHLLGILREKKESLAIVVDEYGSIQGLITDEDLIESVIGEVEDEKSEGQLYSRSGPDTIIASAKLELETFEKIFGIPLESKTGAVTLGGWLIEQLEDIPPSGTKYITGDFLFYVLSSSPSRIKSIYVRQLNPMKKHGR